MLLQHTNSHPLAFSLRMITCSYAQNPKLSFACERFHLIRSAGVILREYNSASSMASHYCRIWRSSQTSGENSEEILSAQRASLSRTLARPSTA